MVEQSQFQGGAWQVLFCGCVFPNNSQMPEIWHSAGILKAPPTTVGHGSHHKLQGTSKPRNNQVHDVLNEPLSSPPGCPAGEQNVLLQWREPPPPPFAMWADLLLHLPLHLLLLHTISTCCSRLEEEEDNK